eukprot:TRINITY_DN195_c0_g1_i2.p1 TRINITY_DN195_c0_g1~~TRINITY_DN195_c0_g1_i2.p1  ORF type:complete len:102 (+),score=0.51 TRINITY_DN195_c0_g1_i2:1156-1461(+)
MFCSFGAGSGLGISCCGVNIPMDVGTSSSSLSSSTESPTSSLLRSFKGTSTEIAATVSTGSSNLIFGISLSSNITSSAWLSLGEISQSFTTYKYFILLLIC